MSGVPAQRDDRSAPFFDGAAEGRLVIKQCTCGHHVAPDRVDCPACRHATFEWVDAVGTATLISWITIHSRPAPGEKNEEHVVGLVELLEGPWMYAALLGTDGARLDVGTPVAVEFISPAGGETIPAFRPA